MNELSIRQSKIIASVDCIIDALRGRKDSKATYIRNHARFIKSAALKEIKEDENRRLAIEIRSYYSKSKEPIRTR